MIIVSACLAGVECRYNGQAFPVAEIIRMVTKGRAMPVCLEILGKLPIPRPCAEQRQGKIFCENGRDVTTEFQTGANRALQIARLVDCQVAILKARSPSCGCGKIYDGTFSGRLVDGNGAFCGLLKKNGIKVYTEDDIHQLRLKE